MTFLPIDQLGCFKASSTVIDASCSLVFPRKGPPDAVSRIRLTRSLFSPCIDWKIALCSLSTGRIDTPFSAARGIIICPAVTRVSLLASAIVLLCSIAAIVGLIPIIPTIAVTSTSASSQTAVSNSPSIPQTTRTGRSDSLSLRSFAASSDHIAASPGRNSLTCRSIRFTLVPAANAATCRSGSFRTISSVCVPIDPVHPSIAIFFITFLSYFVFPVTVVNDTSISSTR